MATPNSSLRGGQAKKVPPPVFPKPKGMTATKLSHKPVPVATPSSDQATEDELDALTDLLVKNLEYSSDPDFFGICHKCGQKVSGEGTGCNAMDKLFHITCFVCHKCGCQLTGKVFYKVEDKSYCEADYMRVTDDSTLKHFMKYILQYNCFSFDSQHYPPSFANIFLSDLKHIFPSNSHPFPPYTTTLEESSLETCWYCNKHITDRGQDETVRIVSMNKDFHVKCYKCEDCQRQLSSDKGGSGCYPLDDHLYCQDCNAKHIQKLTAELDKPPRPLTTEL
ncbi:hypothetical protein QZH41_014674 [Actinostola sp. cb2023]|nr:hypothetical protein QZH41_014674 [Actinostola sp. cb2023]